MLLGCFCPGKPYVAAPPAQPKATCQGAKLGWVLRKSGALRAGEAATGALGASAAVEGEGWGNL